MNTPRIIAALFPLVPLTGGKTVGAKGFLPGQKLQLEGSNASGNNEIMDFDKMKLTCMSLMQLDKTCKNMEISW